MKTFGGKVLFLDRDDINTDEIIPAKYLTEITKDALKPYLLEDLRLEGFDSKRDIEGKSVIVTRANFGCGSSREHAPWALEVNGINVVIAENFARIFRQNMYNCGMFAIELPKEKIDYLFDTYKDKDTTIEIDVDNDKIIISSEGKCEEIDFTIGEFDKALIKEGGWVGYADKHY
ncbi:3-isopropylmalate dehydratase small subunit [Acetivibrio saccincola]|jgi:3-isopropylmalate/(R)-2-methylmalate dehydratase small subunit|uniref:3-isopropylmalate dehydratase small subunit n=1 Tax=Acetivibrio saccincola TaxID=1677857 RepID=A0A2K9E586_9FIRM|nr:3-isopropylmalate dehydratase small subunit [Acetivibrio saccincola]AUG56636.1 3-isopropylmalate dehydratase small subunit [Acetivibrio saccincola]NLW27636.1 3-isopropylmalate dehydratase small subunit [Acetivibrio saccincola]PQQ66705.1 3-isopropylmalate dehydratase small subunit [Acetivibrio saccincola]HQD28177.1 3-isopropylmalate dehydratase small subunit [Acetivibrio saccincola]